MTKIFCIGFHKTGTTSLAKALQTLGYRVTGPNGIDDPDIAANVHALVPALVEKYDAFQDNPWPILYKELDLSYPNSKFILTLRDPVAWIRSAVKHFGQVETPMRRWIYGAGCPAGNESIYLDRFNAHNEAVRAYFAGRAEDLLILDLTEGDGWEKLCGFLGRDIPNVPFPHENQAGHRAKRLPLRKRLTARLKRLLDKI